MVGHPDRRILPAGDRALLVELSGLRAALGFFDAVSEAGLWGVLEAVPAARTVLVRFDPLLTEAAELTDRLATLTISPSRVARGREVTIAVRYDGDDLAEVAGLLGVSERTVIEAHTSTPYRVAFGGFAPGFAYLSGGHPLLDVPRRQSPRTRIPAGAVALAGAFSAVYPRESPGGWQLIGHTDAALWNLDRRPPALLQPGDRVRFVEISSDEPSPVEHVGTTSPVDHVGTAPLVKPVQTNTSEPPLVEPVETSPVELVQATPPVEPVQSTPPDAASPVESVQATPPDAASQVEPVETTQAVELARTTPPSEPAPPSVIILSPGAQALLQDEGRAGLAALGVPSSGALDRFALHQANLLVGNPSDAAVIEFAWGGAVSASGDLVVAVSGERAEVEVVHLDHVARHDWPAPVLLHDGDTLRIVPRAGARSYLAVRGGFAVPPVLGSRSTDVLSGLGPTPLATGARLLVGSPAGLPAVGDPEPWPERLDGAEVRLPVLLGPRDDWFTGEAIGRLFGQSWTVSPHSNRVGLRLLGEHSLTRRTPDELPSEGLVAGAIQVPLSGQPVVFLADHPVTGGYPVIAVLRHSALDLAGQLAPGQRVRFVLDQ